MKITRRYLAGFLDGEGYFGIMAHTRKDCGHGVNYICAIKVAQTDRNIISMLQEQFGGYVHHRKFVGNSKDAYTWEVKNFTSVEKVLDYVFPYLIVKKRQAETLKEFLENKKQSKGSHIEEKDNIKRKNLYNSIRTLNYRGIPPATTERECP